MGLMNFPRYIKREGRDFFYMTLRQMLPGKPLVFGRQGAREGRGRVAPQGPAAAWLPLRARDDGGAARRRAPRREGALCSRSIRARCGVARQAAKATSAKTVAVLDARATRQGRAHGEPLALERGSFSIAAAAPVADAVRLASGQAEASLARQQGALGVSDEDGMLIYAELSDSAGGGPRRTASSSRTCSKKAGCSSHVFLKAPWSLALGGDTSLAGAAMHPPPSGAGAVRLARVAGPGAGRFFEDTPIVPFDKWYALQAKRIRYFKKKE
jgi:hypothetical protein